MNLDLNKLPEFLKAQRWFAGKAWPIKLVTVVDHAPIPGTEREGRGPAVLAVVEVQYQLGNPERYLLPVEPRESGDPADATLEDAVVCALFDILRHGRRVEGGQAALVGEVIPGAQAVLDAIADRPDVRRLGVEQSNTSVVLGDQIIFKLIRKLESGVSPEHEIGRFLMTRTKFRQTPELVGAIHLVGQTSTTLAVAHRFMHGTQEGWRWLLDRLAEGKGDSQEVMRELTSLGQTLADLHRALASDHEDPAFTPEPLLKEDLQRWSSSIIGELGVTISLAEQRFPKLGARREELMERARGLVNCCAGGKKIRLHGDLHLGQVLRTGDGRWMIFDFEGEPGRGFQQRREKHTPLKDVAGLLRSFSYAAATSARSGKPAPGFEKQARMALLGGYMGAVGTELLPDGADAFGLLDAMELEKALYEVRYEINNRPDWAEIPVAVLMEGSR